MSIHSPIGDGIYIQPSRPNRRWIRFFVKFYPYLVGLITSIILAASLAPVDLRVMFIAMGVYWFYLAARLLFNLIPAGRSLYQGIVLHSARTLVLIAGVSLLLHYLYTYTSYLQQVRVDTLWLLYLLAILVISQRGTRGLFIILLATVLACLYIVTPVQGRLLLSSPLPLTLEYLIKSIWLVSLSGITYILLRYMSDAVADMNLIVNVQNHIREMEGKYLRASIRLEETEYLEKCVEVIQGDLKYDHVYVFHLDSTGRALVCIAAACQAGKCLVSEGFTIRVQDQESIIGHVVKTAQSYRSNNVRRDPHYLPHPAFPGVRSELVVPIRSRNRLYGVLDIQVHQSNFFLDQDQKAIEILANNLGWVVDNAQQFEHINWINRIIERIARPLFTQNSLDDTLQEIAEVARKELTADLVMLYSYDPATPGGVLGPIYAGDPYHPELLQPGSPEKDNVVQRLIDRGDPIYCHEDLSTIDLDTHPFFRPSPTHRSTGRQTFIEREQVRAHAIIRLLNNDQCVGVLFLNFRKPRLFTYWDRQRYFSFAHLAALAIQKMNSQQHLIRLEMTDLSNRIHDTLLGSSLGLHKVLNSIDLPPASVGVEKAREAVDLALGMTEQLHKDIRHISRLLKDDPTDDLPFELDRLALAFQQIFHIKIDVHWDVDPTLLPPALSRELLVVIREAVTNAIKHARATSIGISAAVASALLEIRIVDNGQGFDPAQVRRVNGLASMRYRMEELGGKFILESEPGRGTAITLSIPVRNTS